VLSTAYVLFAKYGIPTAVVLYIIEKFCPSEAITAGVFCYLFFSWIASYTICSKYQELYKSTHKERDDLSSIP